MSFTIPPANNKSAANKPPSPNKPNIIPVPSGVQPAEILSEVQNKDPIKLEPVPAKQPVLQFDKELCQAHLDKIAEFQEQFAGKQNMNPYMWLERFVKPLYYRMEGLHPFTSTSQDPDGFDLMPEQTPALQQEILSLPVDEEPTLTNIFKRRKLSELKKLKTVAPSTTQ